MHKTCQKCGAESDVDDSPAAACPSCGVIFAKVDQISVAQRQAIRAAVAARSSTPARHAEDAPPRQPLVERICWGMTAIGAFSGAGQFVFTVANAESAPQQAAGFAMAVAYAVIPYVFARAAQEYRK
jgi:hypothetical protein